MCRFRKIAPEKIDLNPFSILKEDWGLLTSGKIEDFNMMTIAWGYFGVMWNKPIFGAVVRPNRYTFEYMEKNDKFTVSFFPNSFRADLEFCGTRSGRDVNKAFETSFDPIEEGNTVYFSQADTVLICKKLSFQDFKPENFLDIDLLNHYPEKQFHRLYLGEITEIFKKS